MVTYYFFPDATANICILPESIEAGESATLYWAAPGAQSVTIDNGIGTVGESGSVPVSPDQTTTYTITATDTSGNTHTEAVTLNVTQPITVNI